jgi:hypothetical protein
MLDVSIYIEGQKIDLFKDEGISIKSSVKDINDISKVYTDFSKSFTVPASKGNNSIFKHYYNADITGGYDARTSKDGTIEINERKFTQGKISLEKVSIDNGNILHYAIRFTGDTIKIKKDLGDDKLSSLDFTDLNHNFDSATVEAGATSSLFSGQLIYPLISASRRLFYDTSNTVVSSTTQSNTYYDSGVAANSINRKDLKPAIKVSEVFSRILSTYNLNIVGDIFNRDYFTDAFMWLNNNDEGMKLNSDGNTLVDFTSGDTTYTDLATDITTPTLTAGASSTEFTFVMSVTVGILYQTIPYSIVVKKTDGTEVYRSDNLIGNLAGQYIPTLNEGYTFHLESNDTMTFDFSLIWRRTDVISGTTPLVSGITYSPVRTYNSIVDIAKQMPDLKVYDFIMGIVKLYNLVIIPLDNGDLEFITMKEWYNNGVVYDISEFIDRESITVGRGKLTNTFNFNYEKPETLLNKQFLANTGVAYGDLEAKIYDNNGVLLDGGSLTVKVPFENMIFERITDTQAGVLTDMQYGFAVDDKLEPVATKLVLFYNTNQSISTKPIGWLNDSNVHHSISTINVPNNTRSLTDNTTQSLNFGSEFSAYNYGQMDVTIYKSFYEDYISDMFSVKRRQYSYEGYLPLKTITNIRLNDRIVIDNYRYIINGLDKKITSGFVKLDLLNDIYTEGDLLGEQIILSASRLNLSNGLQDAQVTVSAIGITTVEVIDAGDGVFVANLGFDTVTNTGTFTFNILENATAYSRTQLIRFTNGTQWADFVLTQDGAIDLFDVKVDTTLLTVDTTTLTI